MIKILCITPLNSIPDVKSELTQLGEVDFLDDPSKGEVLEIISEYDVLFTNPNKSKVYLGEELLKTSKLKCITTASTGTIHIDVDFAEKNNIKILNLSKEIAILENVTSTAEHAFLLMLAGIRNFYPAVQSVKNKKWDYEPFIGRQMTALKVGVMGYGRLGKMFANYSKAFSAQIKVYDPFVDCKDYDKSENLEDFLDDLDILSIHIHATKTNLGIIDKTFLSNCKDGLLLINTSRGELVNEQDLLDYLDSNNNSKYFTDVLSSETNDLDKNKIFRRSLNDDSILISPHMGGMTVDAQRIAYGHAVHLLKEYITNDLN